MKPWVPSLAQKRENLVELYNLSDEFTVCGLHFNLISFNFTIPFNFIFIK
jgi:hypothetical protein